MGIFDSIRPVQMPDPVEQQSRLYQLMAMQDKAETGALQRQQLQRQLAQESRLAALAQQYGGDQNNLADALQREGMFDASGKLREQQRKATLDQASIDEKRAQAGLHTATAGWRDAQTKVQQLDALKGQAEVIGRAIGSVAATPTPQAAEQALASLEAQGINVSRARQMSVQARIEDERSRWSTLLQDTRSREQMAETGRHNRATEATSQGQLGIAAQRLALERDKAKTEMDTPQYMQTDEGLVALPKKLAPGETPSGVRVLGEDGKPLSKPLKDLPPAVNTAIIENNKALDKINRAVAGIDANKASFGFKGYVPDAILQRMDPNGVEARAVVGDIGSMVIHDRSGAAVTAAEFPRLRPFIPQVTDDPETIKKKLDNFRKELSSVQQDMAMTYSREQGYKPNPAQARNMDKPQPAAATAPAAPSADGPTATGPNGQRLVLRNGQWVPLQ
jgi:hypothetical protein